MENENRNPVYPMAFACYNREQAVRMRSSSGGIFWLLGNCVLEQSGVVFGAKWNERWELIHDEAHSPEELEGFMGSKYVQSNPEDTFLRVREYLDEERLVLFSGTPCQAAGLRCYLGKDYENLIAADVICHGVPSPGVWRKYLQEIKKDRIVTGINFRDKTGGWRNFSLKIDYLSHKAYRKSKYSDMYVRGFLKNIDLRPSCHACRFKEDSRMADITLGDFWGVKRYCPELSDDRGISVVLVWSDRGMRLMECLADKIVKREIPVETVVNTNAAYACSVAHHPERERFFDEFQDSCHVGKLLRKRTGGNLQQRLWRKLHWILEKLHREGQHGNREKPQRKMSGEKPERGAALGSMKLPVLYESEELCCGCTSCQAACPQGAIVMKENREGFLYPWIDEEKCIGCFICMRVCPVRKY